MKVFIYSSPLILRYMQQIFESNEIEVVPFKSVTELRKAGNPDLTLVDLRQKESEVICNYFKERRDLRLIVLIPRDVDWSRLFLLNVSGYIPLDIGKDEFIARLQSITRHFSDFEKEERSIEI